MDSVPLCVYFSTGFSKPPGRVGSDISPGSDRWAWGVLGTGLPNGSQSTMELNHTSRSLQTTPRNKRGFFWKSIFETADHGGGWAILLTGNDFIGRMFYNIICPMWVGCVTKIILSAPGMIFFKPKKPSCAWKELCNLAWSLLNCRGLIRTRRQRGNVFQFATRALGLEVGAGAAPGKVLFEHEPQ